MDELNENVFTVSDYELLDTLMDEALEIMDGVRMTKIKSLKHKIYNLLVEQGRESGITEDIIKLKWDISEVETKDNVKRISVQRRV